MKMSLQKLLLYLNCNLPLKLFAFSIILFFAISLKAQKPINFDSLGRVNTINKALEDSILKDKIKKISPRVAAKKSAVLPGWGQVYSKHYWTIPLIYGGFIASGVFVSINNKKYKEFKRVYIETSIANKTNPAKNTGIVKIKGIETEYTLDILRRGTSIYKRNRDLSFLAIPLTWAVNVLEVNIAAHLKTFDTTDDISWKIAPKLINELQPWAPMMGASLTLTLK